VKICIIHILHHHGKEDAFRSLSTIVELSIIHSSSVKHLGDGLDIAMPERPNHPLAVEDFQVFSCSLLFRTLITTTMSSSFILTCGVLLANSLIVAAQNDPCTVCPNGDPITLPEKALRLQGFEFIDSCGALDSTIGIFLQSDADECALIRSASSLCGCPIPEGACYLCGENSFVQQPDRQVPYLLNIKTFTPTCEFIEAYLHSISATDSMCGVTKTFTGSYCGCPDSPPIEGPMCTLCPRGEAVPDANRLLSIQGIPFETCGEAEQAAVLYLSQDSDTCNIFQSVSSLCGCETSSSLESSCSLCPDGSSVALPEEDLRVLLGASASIRGSDLRGIELTCRVVEAAALTFEEDSQDCRDVRFVAGVCGCPPIENACDFCPGEDLVYPDREMRIAVTVLNAVPTCGQINGLGTQVKKGSAMCDLANSVNFVCGCNGGERVYLGAKTHSQKVWLAWVPRISASLSLFGSSMIIYDILRDRTKVGSVFHTLMVAMSLFDIIGSIAWAFSSLPIPVYEYGAPSGIYGAKGNEATCKTQGFFIQLGYTSIFYNMSLSFYFMLVVRFGMKENQLKKLQLWLYIPPLIVGFALAFGGIPYYGNVFFVCYIAPPPLVEDYRYIVIFAVVPICTAIVILTFNTGLVYWAVRKQMIAARKWRIRVVLRPNRTPSAENTNASGALSILPDASGVGEQSRNFGSEMPQTVIQKMERQTFWRALFYLGAFYLTWPILIASNLNSYVSQSFPAVITVLILAPLQGFINFLLYARPRIQRALKDRRRNSKYTADSSPPMSAVFGMNIDKTASIPKLKSKEGDTEEGQHCLPDDVPDQHAGRGSPLRFDVAAMVDDSP
jgi:hypothetical protein